MAKLKLKIALDRYDRHGPLFEGAVSGPPDVELECLNVGQGGVGIHGTDRNRRTFPGGEFDVAEYGLAPYIIAKSRMPDFPMTAIPVFPRRLFSQGRMYVNIDAGIDSPGDLIGKKVGLNSFQNSLAILAKGDLLADYGVRWQDISWVASVDEHFESEQIPDLSIDYLGPGSSIGEMLLRGEIDAHFCPHIPAPLLGGSDRIQPLFKDPKTAIIDYFGSRGFFPIMHLIVVRQELLEREPWLAGALYDMFEAANRLVHDYYDDPNYSILAWGRDTFEEQRETMGTNLWPSGLAANRRDLEQFIGYCHEQHIIDAPMSAESLFHDSVLHT
ncbi:MAG: 4,5-dihydroxyphthalate decarboxylase [Rhodospirillaceae bacterium]|jgi:4,5-dihydroxyphthalate decarboxylase|nr:4,5-dihydroxyphthalate decarboxylase [Rhodospirillaceae bacterium]MBT5457320.1 4,5-dihydroxyphthalate decarboxylase [Rhodospirillaceae bacterium]